MSGRPQPSAGTKRMVTSIMVTDVDDSLTGSRRVVVTDCVGYPEPGSIEQSELGPEYQVVVANATTEEEVVAAAGTVEGLFVNMAPITKNVLHSLPKLRALVRYGVGMDNVDCDEAAALGIVALNVPDYAVEEVAQHAASMIIARARRLAEYNAAVKGGAWGPDIVAAPAPPDEDTVGIAGFGNIGRRTGQILGSVGFPVVAWDPYVPAASFAGVERARRVCRSSRLGFGTFRCTFPRQKQPSEWWIVPCSTSWVRRGT